jgi:hypothetical protein
MTIKQQGGIFGRNPEFNDVDISGNLNVDGRLGVGTDNPDSEFVVENSSSQAVVQVKGTTNSIFRARSLSSSGNGYFAFGDPDDAYIGGVNYNHSNDSMSLYVNNETRFVLDSSGNATVSNGNLVIGTSGKGIDFSATSGTGTSELFDDYEEGTWTPAGFNAGSTGIVVGASPSYSGVYTKAGRFVNCRIDVDVDNGGTNAAVGDLFYFGSGLPFTPDVSLTTGAGVGVIYNSIGANSLGMVEIFLSSSAVYMKVIQVSGTVNYGLPIRGNFSYSVV